MDDEPWLPWLQAPMTIILRNPKKMYDLVYYAK